MTATHPDALPSPGFIGKSDGTAFDQSDWRQGALQTRVLDPDVQPYTLRLTWENVSQETVDGILLHHQKYATGAGGQRLFPLPLPGGSTIDVHWIGPVAVTPISGRFYNVDGQVEIARANDTGAVPPLSTPQMEDGATIELENGIVLSWESRPTLPVVP